ncbi:MAG: DUF5615 family PIN-like protein [Acidobacteriota bacterium]|nr:DUF5615 family PIN-like protein [Acidobacteriota bacterium]
MMVKYLLDENVDLGYRTQLLRHAPTLVAWAVNDPGAPAKETLDPAILCWCEDHDFILVTHNRSSMPGHLADHLTAGRHVPGIFVLSPELSMGATIAELVLIASASFADEYQDRISYLPLT